MRIEQVMSKQRILELYLNEIYLGLGSYGVAAAAQAYFNKPLDQLTLPEAAFLAALPKAPNNYNPFKYPRRGEGAARLGAGPHGRGPRDHRGAGGGGEGAADRAAEFRRPRADAGGRLVHRGGAARADRSSSARTRRRRAG